MLLLLALPSFVLASGGWTPGAPRYWPKYGLDREVKLLDGSWNFGFIDGWDSGFDSMSKAFSPGRALTPNKTTVPSCMDVVAGGAPGYLGPRGVGMYRTTFASTAAGAPLRLQFQSCSFYCRVWVNGKEVGDHLAGGYVAFSLDVPAHVLTPNGGANDLFVLADNRFNATTAPMHTGGDFWHYGGLTRSVELHTLSADHPVLWRAYVQPAASDVTQTQPSGAPESVDITC
jgi:beta-glucuronidase